MAANRKRASGGANPAPANATPVKTPSPAQEGQPALSIACKAGAFWRAGRKWTETATVVRLTELTDAQIRQLESEPMLIVRHGQIETQA